MVQAQRVASAVAAVALKRPMSANRKFVTQSGGGQGSAPYASLPLLHNAGSDNLGQLKCLDPDNANTRCNELMSTVQGTSQSNRIGDSVHAVGVSVRLSITSNNLTYAAICPEFRVIVLQNYHGFNPKNDNNIFKSGANPNKLLAMVDTDKFRVRYDKIIQGSTTSTVRFHKLFIKVNKKFKYQSDNGLVPADESCMLALYVIGVAQQGTAYNTEVAYVSYETTFYFRDT